MPQYANEVPVLDVADKIGANPLRYIATSGETPVKGDVLLRSGSKASVRRRRSAVLKPAPTTPQNSKQPSSACAPTRSAPKSDYSAPSRVASRR